MSELEGMGIPEAEVVDDGIQQTVEGQQPDAAVVESTAATAPIVAVSNQEAMVAQTLSRLKKQSKQVEKASKLIAQIPGQLKDLEKRQAKQFGRIDRQLRQLQSQINALQKRIPRKAAVSSSKKKKAKKLRRKK